MNQYSADESFRWAQAAYDNAAPPDPTYECSRCGKCDEDGDTINGDWMPESRRVDPWFCCEHLDEERKRASAEGVTNDAD